MARWIRVGCLLMGCLLSFGIVAAQTINTDNSINPIPPNAGSSFLPTLQNFLLKENADRTARMFGPFVYMGGVGPTSVTLTHTVSAIEAFVHGYAISQDATALTYTASRRSYVYLDSLLSRTPEISVTGGSGCTFAQRYARLIRVECAGSSAAPTLSTTGLLALFYADTSTTAITAVTDMRWRSPLQQSTVQFYIKEFGAKCDGVTDDTEAIRAAINVKSVAKPKVILCPGDMIVNGTLAITSPVTIEGAGSRVSIMKSQVANVPMITIAAGVTDVVLTQFGLDRSLSSTAGGDGIVTYGAHNNITISDMMIINQWDGMVLGVCAYCQTLKVTTAFNNSNGIRVDYGTGAESGAAQWQITETLAQNNLGVGILAENHGTPVGIGPFISDTTAFNNKGGGILIIGDASHSVNDVWIMRYSGSFNNVNGLYMDTYGIGHMLSMIWVEYSGQGNTPAGSQWAPQTPTMQTESSGITFINNSPGLVLNGGMSFANGSNGVEVTVGTPNGAVLNMSIFQNGLGLSTFPYKRTGIYVNGESTVVQGNAFGIPGTQTSYIYYGPNISQSITGLNTYHPSLPESAWINVADALLMFLPPQMPAGLTIGMGVRRPFMIKDMDGGVTPKKFIGVSNGIFYIQNDNNSANLMTLTNGGMPAFPLVPSAPAGSKAACFNASGELFRSATGSCP